MVTQNNIEILEVDEAEAIDVDLKDEYLKMVSATKSASFDISQHEELFENIFMDYKEKLITEVGNPYFICGKNKLTDFATVVLELKEVHYLDFVLDEVVLLVLSEYEQPKIITVASGELGSCKWIDNYLGIKYMYTKEGIEKIKKIIQTMTRYAPLKEEYKYSGWLTGSNCAYVINGKPHDYKKALENNDEKQSCEFALNMLNVAEHAYRNKLFTKNSKKEVLVVPLKLAVHLRFQNYIF